MDSHNSIKDSQLNKIIRWKVNESNKLVQLIKEHGKDWDVISKKMENRSVRQCSQKYFSLQRAIKSGLWSSEEDNFILQWVKINGLKKFKLCSKQLGTKNVLQCLERWETILNPKIKRGKWTERDQLKLFKSLKQYGKICPQTMSLLNRNYISIKNFFSFSIKKLQKSKVLSLLKKTLNENSDDKGVDSGKSMFLNQEYFHGNSVHSEFKNCYLRLNLFCQLVIRYWLKHSREKWPFAALLRSFIFSRKELNHFIFLEKDKSIDKKKREIILKFMREHLAFTKQMILNINDISKLQLSDKNNSFFLTQKIKKINYQQSFQTCNKLYIQNNLKTTNLLNLKNANNLKKNSLGYNRISKKKIQKKTRQNRINSKFYSHRIFLKSKIKLLKDKMQKFDFFLKQMHNINN